MEHASLTYCSKRVTRGNRSSPTAPERRGNPQAPGPLRVAGPALTRAVGATCFAAWLVGCASAPTADDNPQQYKMLALLMPSRIEIVEPFTRVRSFGDTNQPDGIELLVQAVNSLDNPGLMIAGNIRVELYEYVAASGDQKGKPLERWDVELTTARHQKTYWNQLTQMYEFRLGINPAKIPRAERYVLVVTYDSPLGERLTDEFVLKHTPASGPLGG